MDPKVSIWIIQSLLILALLYLAHIDWRTLRLPNAITFPLIVFGITFNWVSDLRLTALSSALLGALLGYASLWALNAGYRLLQNRNGIGMGDAKLLAALGAWLGWSSLPSILLMASVSGIAGGVRPRLLVARQLVGRVSRFFAGAGAFSLFSFSFSFSFLREAARRDPERLRRGGDGGHKRALGGGEGGSSSSSSSSLLSFALSGKGEGEAEASRQAPRQEQQRRQGLLLLPRAPSLLLLQRRQGLLLEPRGGRGDPGGDGGGAERRRFFASSVFGHVVVFGGGGGVGVFVLFCCYSRALARALVPRHKLREQPRRRRRRRRFLLGLARWDDSGERRLRWDGKLVFGFS